MYGISDIYHGSLVEVGFLTPLVQESHKRTDPPVHLTLYHGLDFDPITSEVRAYQRVWVTSWDFYIPFKSKHKFITNPQSIALVAVKPGFKIHVNWGLKVKFKFVVSFSVCYTRREGSHHMKYQTWPFIHWVPGISRWDQSCSNIYC